MAIKCCNGCVAPKRHPGCHDHCEKYQKAKAEYDERKEAERKQKEISFGITAQRSSAVTKAIKGRRNHFRNMKKGE